MLQRAAFDEHDIAGLDGNVGSGAHGDTEIGLGQRRRIVDAVADERDALLLSSPILGHNWAQKLS